MIEPVNTSVTFSGISRGRQRSSSSRKREGGSLWDDALAKGGKVAQKYMEQFAKSPKSLADKMVSLIHTPSRRCADRVLINVSPLMRAARYTPQWILDWAFRRQMNA